MGELTIAVTGLNAADNPGPGVAVVRAIRAGAEVRAAGGRGCRIVGLTYDALDPGAYMGGVAIIST